MAFRGKKGLIGLDIGASSIKVAELKEIKKGYQLENFGMVPLPPEAIVDGALMNSPAIVEAIQTLISDRKIKVNFPKLELDKPWSDAEAGSRSE